MSFYVLSEEGEDIYWGKKSIQYIIITAMSKLIILREQDG